MNKKTCISNFFYYSIVIGVLYFNNLIWLIYLGQFIVFLALGACFLAIQTMLSAVKMISEDNSSGILYLIDDIKELEKSAEITFKETSTTYCGNFLNLTLFLFSSIFVCLIFYYTNNFFAIYFQVALFLISFLSNIYIKNVGKKYRNYLNIIKNNIEKYGKNKTVNDLIKLDIINKIYPDRSDN